jgi:endoribonuclease Dicer
VGDCVQTAADVVEALIGAAFMSGGVASAFRAAKALRIQIPYASTYQEIVRYWKEPPPPFHYPVRMKEAVDKVQHMIGYQFKHVTFLYQALASLRCLPASL